MTLPRVMLGLLLLATAALGLVGLDWGLPSTSRRELMLPGAAPEQLAAIARAGTRSADQALSTEDDNIATDQQMLKTYFRVLLHSCDPDEYLVLKGLRGLPRLDPGVYRYGGPFLGGAALFIAAGHVLGLTHLTADAAWYLEHPEEFARLYMAMRLFVVALALLVVYAAFRFGRLWGGEAAGLLTAALVAFMPATVNWLHVAKPHLPACAFLFLAAEMAVRYYRGEVHPRRLLILSGLFSGLAAAFALSFAPVVLIPATAIVAARRRQPVRLLGHAAIIGACALAVVLVTNPWYVTRFSAVAAEARGISSDVAERYGANLAAAGGAMAALHATAGFFTRLLPLAMSWPMAGLGLLAGLVAVMRHREALLFVPAWLAAAAMVIWSVGLSLEPNVARFALVPAMLLAPAFAATAVGLLKDSARTQILLPLAAALVVAVFSLPYLAVYRYDSLPDNTRYRAGVELAERLGLNRPDGPTITLGTIMTPTAYNLPPIPLARCRLVVLSELRPPAETELPQYLLLDSLVEARRPRGWWEGLYQPVAELPAPFVDRHATWKFAPMSLANFEFTLLSKK